MLESDFQVVFYLRKSKATRNGDAPIYMRLVHCGAQKDLATKLTCKPERWNSHLKLVNAVDKADLEINNKLMGLRLKVGEVVNQLGSVKVDFTLLDVKDGLNGKLTSDGFLEFFQLRIDEMEALIGKGYSKSTIVNYRSAKKHLEKFLKDKLKRNEMSMRALDYHFIDRFLSFLRIEQSCQTNTANKYLRALRAVLYEAKKRSVILKNPFESFSIKYDKTSRGYLTEQELQSIMNKKIGVHRVAFVRDMFVFACFTGLAYADLKELKNSHIVERNGKKWIIKPRVKSNVDSVIPLLSGAERIIKAHQKDTAPNSLVFHIPSNQKINAYLKEVADLAEIDKNLTFHIARHTFATTVTLTNNVPIESVSKMLGHSSIKTTQIYAKVVESKLEKDMELVMEKYSGDI
ncbi:site-specific integrase [Owenweeksia hongkongensis]|uniref:site-specific integrase n=1 Tax=Owenweeksia hongkongensis TaxID=253245 RepID=UPI003A8DC0C5